MLPSVLLDVPYKGITHILGVLTSAEHASKLMGDCAPQLTKFTGRKQQLHLCSKEAGKLPACF